MPYQKTHASPTSTAVREDIFGRLANALQKLTEGASPAVGSDCFLHAKLAQTILSEEGIPTEIVAGESAWRIGPGDQDVIAHSANASGSSFTIAPGSPLPIHVWLKTSEGEILDFTTHSLRIKARLLDESDGGHTVCAWCPPYLLVSPRRTTFKEVLQATTSGVFHYLELPGLMDVLMARGVGVGEIDDGDLSVLRYLFRNPETRVVGPNHGNEMMHALMSA